jgi:hypothetical protein
VAINNDTRYSSAWYDLRHGNLTTAPYMWHEHQKQKKGFFDRSFTPRHGEGLSLAQCKAMDNPQPCVIGTFPFTALSLSFSLSLSLSVPLPPVSLSYSISSA